MDSQQDHHEEVYEEIHEQNHRENSENEYEKYVQDCNKTLLLGLFHRRYFFIPKDTCAFRVDKQHYNTTLFCGICMITLPAVKFFQNIEKNVRKRVLYYEIPRRKKIDTKKVITENPIYIKDY